MERAGPALIQEGLAVWLQSTTPNQTMTAEIMDWVSSFGIEPLKMLDPRYFFATDRMHVSYILAGAFTGFLISPLRLGPLSTLLHQGLPIEFRREFQSHFGVSFEEAWRRCHDESVARARLYRELAVVPVCTGAWSAT